MIKISELPAAVTAGLNDFVPLVQGTETKRVRPFQLTAGTPITQAEYNALAANVLAASYVPTLGERYRITDGLLSGRILEWNGESFGGSAPIILHQRFAAQSRNSGNVAGDTTPQAIESITIPGYLMRANSKLRITTDWAFTAPGTSKILAIYWAGSAMGAPTISTAGLITAKILTEIFNFNSVSAQRAYNSTSYGNNTNPYLTSAVDTRSPITVDFSCRWTAAVASETITLMGYAVELIP